MNIPIDEQIARQRAVIRHCEGKSGINIDGDKAILATLERIKAADAGLPVEPDVVKLLSEQDYEYNRKTNALIKRHAEQIDSLQFALQRAHTERDNWQETARQYAGNSDYWRERAEKAEALNKRMVELMKEPSDGMWSAVWVSIKVPPLQRARSVLSVHDLRLLWAAFHQAMSAELLKEVGE